MSFYNISSSQKVSISRNIQYECENCGKTNSYKQNHNVGIFEEGVTAGKSQKEYQEVSQEIQSKVNKRVDDELQKFKEKKPEFPNCGYEKCPGCEYTQSWMIDARVQDRIGKIVVLPIGVVTLIIAIATIFEMSNQFYPSDAWLRCLYGFIIWAIVSFVIFYFGNRFSKIRANRGFSKVNTINEPILTWDDPIITK